MNDFGTFAGRYLKLETKAVRENRDSAPLCSLKTTVVGRNPELCSDTPATSRLSCGNAPYLCSFEYRNNQTLPVHDFIITNDRMQCCHLADSFTTRCGEKPVALAATVTCFAVTQFARISAVSRDPIIFSFFFLIIKKYSVHTTKTSTRRLGFLEELIVSVYLQFTCRL